MAEFRDFLPSTRRHYTSAASQSSLGPGCNVKQDVPDTATQDMPHLHRSRVVHDAAELYTIEDSFLSTQHREDNTSQWMSSYQAQCMGMKDDKRPQGKKTMPNARPQNLATFIGHGAPVRSGDMSHLVLGTTKASDHVPGYTGHIPVDNTKVIPVQPRGGLTDKTLIVENYKPIPGYTGKRR